jgi:hypothetical protein
MKKFSLTLLTILILTLTACGSASNGTEPASNTQGSPAAGALPATTKLIIGTLKLEGTVDDVTAEQAAELLPLWQTLQVLSESDTAAQGETDTLIEQIQETMTAGQIQAINGMNLTQQDILTVMQDQGVQFGDATQQDNQGNSSQNNDGGVPGDRFPGGGPGSGFPGGGGGPDGGFGGGQGQNLNPDQIATAQASRQERSGNFIPPMLINALIDFLREKAGF